MRREIMGKVVVAAKLENIGDILKAAAGEIPPDQVRHVEVTDALVDTGATMLLVPKSIIQTLGLIEFRQRPSRGLGGPLEMHIFTAVRLTVQGRDCTVDVGEIPDEFPMLIGQVPLELLDWVVDTRGQKLVGNPEHGGQQMIDVFVQPTEDSGSA
jgi:predicted aspartyl protease